MEKSVWYKNNHIPFLEREVNDKWFWFVAIITLGILTLILL